MTNVQASANEQQKTPAAPATNPAVAPQQTQGDQKPAADKTNEQQK